ncbi:very short patch repair endonuclease [Mesorhizobium sp. BR1-1-9]|uniref:very short patch repair endonuclease n=1 Tax=Mesorhizobium sp. BR1-1-9 TaxID=2876646 RepID=UPI001CD0B607|nr:very short patch repair endonuclease [Mesorhizobium sp. BR1-1-9]MBZ9871589.1 very short patch repair endonuclease [Mesorhizobium sp. BR1-1-9]
MQSSDNTADPFAPEMRSAIMAKVSSKDTAPELRVRSLLFRSGFRFRLHQRHLPGSPDIVLKKHNAAVFVHGCFWHGHNCRSGMRRPKANADYWAAKLDRNMTRDRDACARLEAAGWTVHVVWACQLEEDTKRVIAALRAQ